MEHKIKISTTVAHEGEPTHKKYPIRTQTIEDLVKVIPPHRLEQAISEIMESVRYMSGVYQGIKVLCEASGVSEEEAKASLKFPPIHEWDDDGKGEVGCQVRANFGTDNAA